MQLLYSYSSDRFRSAFYEWVVVCGNMLRTAFVYILVLSNNGFLVLFLHYFSAGTSVTVSQTATVGTVVFTVSYTDADGDSVALAHTSSPASPFEVLDCKLCCTFP